MRFATAALSLLVALGYLVYKLLFWQQFSLGVAPLVIGLFFLSSVQLFFVGIVGEYIGSIYTQVKNHPLVFEQERINFDDDARTEGEALDDVPVAAHIMR